LLTGLKIDVSLLSARLAGDSVVMEKVEEMKERRCHVVEMVE